MNRRDFVGTFSRNVAKFGLVSAIGLAAGFGKTKVTEAGYPCIYSSWPISACTSCQGWVCNNGTHGTCDGTFTHNNCAYYGLSSGCCR